MSPQIRPIQVHHDLKTYDVDASTGLDAAPLQLTLLELVQAVGEVSSSEQELVASIVYMLRSGRVRLAGNFRNVCLDDLES